MGRQGDRQGELMVMWSEMPRSPGHVFYDRLQEVLLGAGFDGFVEEACRAYYAKTMGAPSVPPGRYFRMHMVGYFEGIDGERLGRGSPRNAAGEHRSPDHAASARLRASNAPSSRSDSCPSGRARAGTRSRHGTKQA